MNWVNDELWGGDPADWMPWLVLANRMIEVGDVRGQLLREESGGSFNERLAVSWLASMDDDPVVARLWYLVGVRELLEPLRGLAPLEFPPLRPLSQVFAAANQVGTTHYLIEGYTNAILHAALGWIRHAFAVFVSPDEEHRSLSQAFAADNYGPSDRSADPPADVPWWELPDEYLIEYAAPIFLDDQGMAFYGPALMALHLREGFEPGLDLNYTDSLCFLLEEDPPEERYFRLYGPEQAAAVAAFGAMLANRTICETWIRRVTDQRSTEAELAQSCEAET